MHNLEQIDGKTAFVAYREPAWHQLGEVVQEELTAESAISKAMLDWTVELHPVQATVLTDTGVNVIEIEDKFATVRKHPMKDTHDVLGVVGSRYTPIQNKQVFSFLDALVDGGAKYETAGSIDGGRKVFITMQMPEGILVDGQDKSDMYIFATTSHDGSFSLSVALTAVRVVCQNTWRMARRASAYKHTIRHTANSNKSIATAREVMKLSFEYGGFLQEEADKLTKVSLTKDDVMDFNKLLFPYPEDIAKKIYTPGATLDSREQAVLTKVDERRAQLFNLYQSSPGQVMLPENGWRLYNSVTEWADYYAPTRGNTERLASRVVLGANDVIKDRALELILA